MKPWTSAFVEVHYRARMFKNNRENFGVTWHPETSRITTAAAITRMYLMIACAAYRVELRKATR